MTIHDVIGKSYGIVCIEGVLYMWVGMFQTHEDQFDLTRIAYSTDYGKQWTFAFWTFTREDGVMMPTICNFDRNYENARDEFMYVYLIRFQS